MPDFYQDPPVLGNQYTSDRVLRTYLQRMIPRDGLRPIEQDLTRFGDRVVGDILEWGRNALANEPKLVQYDPWGRRIDRIDVSQGWLELERISAEEGLVAIGYERKFGASSRLYQFAKLYLFNPSSAVYSCPLAMADGAARAIEVYGDAWLKDRAYRRLTSRDPEQFWTSGQWMTERTGGSDVGGTSTIARQVEGMWRLYGTKWFTSATTSPMAMTLARIEDASGRTVEGSRGLSLFYLETYQSDGRLNHIQIHRLKDKLGTRALPTAELTLDGAAARLVGEPGQGVRNIASLMNVTRLYNAMSSAAGIRRGIALARDYATRRVAFGRKLIDLPLHQETLARLEVDFEAAFHLAFHTIALMGKDECGEATADESALLRLLTPLAKLFTAKLCIAASSEVLESFGGAGYIEDTGLPMLLRDAQVLSIWEGTTNVLSLDVLRAMARDDAFEPLIADAMRRMERVRDSRLSPVVDAARQALGQLIEHAQRLATDGSDAAQASARDFALGMARTYVATLLAESAEWSLAREAPDLRPLAVALRWRRMPLVQSTQSTSCEGDARALAADEPLAELAASSGSASAR